MWSHPTKYHKDAYNKLKGKDTLQAELIPINNGNSSQTNQNQSILTTMLSSYKPLSKNKIDRLIADMIIIDLQPYSIEEDKGFLSLMKADFPHYQVSCRKYIVTYIEKLFH